MEKKDRSKQHKGKQVSAKARDKANRIRNRARSTPISRWLQSAFYAVWTLIGIILVIAFFAALLGNGTLTDNLQISDEQEATQQTQQQQTQTPPQQQQGPTEEQLACIQQELGEERLTELEKGDTANQEETIVIQECLQQ